MDVDTGFNYLIWLSNHLAPTSFKHTWKNQHTKQTSAARLPSICTASQTQNIVLLASSVSFLFQWHQSSSTHRISARGQLLLKYHLWMHSSVCSPPRSHPAQHAGAVLTLIRNSEFGPLSLREFEFQSNPGMLRTGLFWGDVTLNSNHSMAVERLQFRI